MSVLRYKGFSDDGYYPRYSYHTLLDYHDPTQFYWSVVDPDAPKIIREKNGKQRTVYWPEKGYPDEYELAPCCGLKRTSVRNKKFFSGKPLRDYHYYYDRDGNMITLTRPPLLKSKDRVPIKPVLPNAQEKWGILQNDITVPIEAVQLSSKYSDFVGSYLPPLTRADRRRIQEMPPLREHFGETGNNNYLVILALVLLTFLFYKK